MGHESQSGHKDKAMPPVACASMRHPRHARRQHRRFPQRRQQNHAHTCTPHSVTVRQPFATQHNRYGGLGCSPVWCLRSRERRGGRGALPRASSISDNGEPSVREVPALPRPCWRLPLRHGLCVQKSVDIDRPMHLAYNASLSGSFGERMSHVRLLLHYCRKAACPIV
jgi:hypothetical protein